MIAYFLHGFMVLCGTVLYAGEKPTETTTGQSNVNEEKLKKEALELVKEGLALRGEQEIQQQALREYLRKQRQKQEVVRTRERNYPVPPPGLLQQAAGRPLQVPVPPQPPTQNIMQRAWATVKTSVNRTIDAIVNKIVVPLFRWIGFIR